MRMTLLLFVILIPSCISLDNGLALTPPMGWLTWTRFKCETDCVNHPTTCISENLIKTMADIMVSEGYLEAGYEYVMLDDCWPAPARDENGRLQADPQRFPSGIKALSAYVHSKGLKMGIYEDYGIKTCAGFPGSLFHLEIDAQTFAEWDVDFLKFDGCYSIPLTMDEGYPKMSHYLNATGRPILFSCEWPLYEKYFKTVNYTAVAAACNIWRNHGDIVDSWNSVKDIINWYGDHQDTLIPVAGPGHFNDPDMIVVGDFGLNEAQSRVQMALWSVLASPLIMSNDLRSMEPWQKALLLNKNVLTINQDKLGIQGRRTVNNATTSVWIKEMMTKRFAFAILNLAESPLAFSMTLNSMGLNNFTLYAVIEAFNGSSLGLYKSTDTFSCKVDPTGVSLFIAQAVASPKKDATETNFAHDASRDKVERTNQMNKKKTRLRSFPKEDSHQFINL